MGGVDVQVDSQPNTGRGGGGVGFKSAVKLSKMVTDGGADGFRTWGVG